MNRREEIEARLAAIRTEMDDDGADIDALTDEVRVLKEELTKIEKRAALMREVSGGGGTVVRTFGEPAAPEVFGAETEEYDRLKAAYDEQKAQLRTATGYTDWGDE